MFSVPIPEDTENETVLNMNAGNSLFFACKFCIQLEKVMPEDFVYTFSTGQSEGAAQSFSSLILNNHRVLVQQKNH